jgi:hypothetical protein
MSRFGGDVKIVTRARRPSLYRVSLAGVLGPIVFDTQRPVKILDQRGTVFDPIARIAVGNGPVLRDDGNVDVTADDDVALPQQRIFRQTSLECGQFPGDLCQAHFDLRAKPYRFESHEPPQPVPSVIAPEQQLVSCSPNPRSPWGPQFRRIELIAVRDSKASPVGPHVNELIGDFEQAEIGQEIA